MQAKSIVSLISAIAISVAVVLGAMLTSSFRTPKAQAPDKTGPGVVRVSIVDGSVVVQRGASRVQTNAVRNAPMLPGDYISTGKSARAELQFDGYTAVRLGGEVQARIAGDDPNTRRLQLASGVIEIGMVRDGHTMQIDTPSVTVRAHQAGDVRISIGPDGSNSITARKGSVDVITPERTNAIGAGTTLIARGPASHPTITYGPELALDSFDDFNAQRDATMVAALNASPNLNPSIAGYENLNAYGHWQSVAGYGQSWVPDEPASWVPYRNGSWSWEGKYGWTWVGDEPWGWTPYHYGNWYYCNCGGSGWAWLPPASTKTLAWSPALVGFFGFDVASTGGYNNCGGNYAYAPESYNAPAESYSNPAPAGAPYSQPAPAAAQNNEAGPAPSGEGGPSAPAPSGPGGYSYPAPAPYGMGSGYPPPTAYPYPYIGWVPIAPYEPFYPWFSFGFGFPSTSIINITNVTYINRVFRNFRHGGATGTTFRHFRHGTVSGHTGPVTGRDIGHHFGRIRGALPIKPMRDNLAFSHGKVQAPVSFSKLLDSPRFALDRGLATRSSFSQRQNSGRQVLHGGFSGHGVARSVEHRANASVSRVNAPVGRMNAPVGRVNAPVARAYAPETHANARQARWNAPVTRENAPVTRENAPMARRENAPMARRENAPAMQRENVPVTRRENVAPAMRDENRTDAAPSSPWGRFNAARGDAANDARRADASAPNEMQREERAPSDSWGRFSQQRGDVSAPVTRESNPYSRGGSESRGEPGANPYSRDNPYQRNPYERNPYERTPYERTPYDRAPSERPSYARPDWGPPNSRGSYGAPPSYSHGSYGAPPSRGAPPPSRPSGGGGEQHHGDGHRPPQ
jgi:hypothetical protein